MSGYIKIHRRLKRHWLWTDPVKFQWWVIMIMEANFSDSKMKLGNEIITVKRGQSAMSIRSWAKLFDTGVKSATNFLELLQKDGMISKQTVGKGKQSTTLVNIENYELFQGDEETQRKRKGNAKETQAQREGHTIEEDNKGNNISAQKADREILKKAFEGFWSFYGKKVDRKKSFEKWMQYVNLSNIDHVRSSLKIYISKTPEVQYRKNPLTWLNGQCWLDYPIDAKPELGRINDSFEAN